MSVIFAPRNGTETKHLRKQLHQSVSGAAWQRTCFGYKGSQVQILSHRPLLQRRFAERPQLSWIEQRPSKPWVAGSNPAGRAMRVRQVLTRMAEFSSLHVLQFTCKLCKHLYGGRSSVGRAPDCDSGCRGFKSHRPPHFLRKWWNWQTRWIQVPVLHGVRVQVSPSAPYFQALSKAFLQRYHCR